MSVFKDILRVALTALWLTFLLLIASPSAYALVNAKPLEANDEAGKSMVGLVIQRQDKSIGYCSGSLVGESTILTAAHCLNNSTITSITAVFDERPYAYHDQAVTSRYRLKLDKEDDFYQHFPRLRRTQLPAKIFPAYWQTKVTVENAAEDLALIYLTDPAPNDTAPLQIADPSIDLQRVGSLTVMASGSEQISVLEPYFDDALNSSVKEGQAPLLKKTSAFTSLLHDRNLADSVRRVLGSTGRNKQLIMVDGRRGVKVSNGDSGAPALVYRDGTPSIVGVLSMALHPQRKANLSFALISTVTSEEKHEWLKKNIH